MYKSIIGDDEIYLFYKYSCVTKKNEQEPIDDFGMLYLCIIWIL